MEIRGSSTPRAVSKLVRFLTRKKQKKANTIAKTCTMLLVKQPVYFTDTPLGAVVTATPEHPYEYLPATNTLLPLQYDCRKHPKWRLPARAVRSGAAPAMVRAVASVRDVNTPVDTAAGSMLELCAAQSTSVAYVVSPDCIQQEIASRGPVMTSFEVHQSFVDFWEALQCGNARDAVYNSCVESKEASLGSVAVAIVGWGSDPLPHWVVANCWGRTSAAAAEWGVNGYFRVVRGGNVGHMEENVVGVLPTAAFRAGGDSGVAVIQLTPSLLSKLKSSVVELPPLPVCPDLSQFSPAGKVDMKDKHDKHRAKKKKKKKKRTKVGDKRVKANLTLGHGKDVITHPKHGKTKRCLAKLCHWLGNDEAPDNPGMILQCITSVFMIVICILMLVALRAKQKY